MQSRQFAKQLSEKLQSVYDSREAENIARYLLDELYGKEFFRENKILNPAQLDYLHTLEPRLLQAEPIQYVLEKSWFYGRPFYVNKHVLIPRPETEELIENIIRQNKNASPAILDIGTGSGCIAITLKLEIPNSIVTAMDISGEALAVAKKNAGITEPPIEFILDDILSEHFFTSNAWDIIVSNPPYVDPADAQTLHRNVLNFEPHLALFGPDEEPLKFYRLIAEFAKTHLNPGGQLWFEIPENNDQPIQSILKKSGFNSIQILTDMQGKKRIVSGNK